MAALCRIRKIEWEIGGWSADPRFDDISLPTCFRLESLTYVYGQANDRIRARAT